jgi:transposase
VELHEAITTIELLRGQVTALEQQVLERDVQLREARTTIELQHFELSRLRHALYGDKRERFLGDATPPPSSPDFSQTPASNDGAPQSATSSAAKTPDTHVAEDATLAATQPKESPSVDENGEPLWPRRKAKVKAHEREIADPQRKKQKGCALAIDLTKVTEQHEHHYPDSKTCSRCGRLKRVIDEETHRRIERELVRFKCIITHRYKMACCSCHGDGVVIAPLEDPPAIGAGMIGESFAIDIVLQHYDYHMPFNRLATMYQADGVHVDRSTLSRVAGRTADQFAQIVDVMEEEQLGCDDVLGLDGTGIKILAQPHCIRREVYVRHNKEHVVFRVLKHKDAETVLKGFERLCGVPLGDAASVHIGTTATEMDVFFALCNVHARRKFRDVCAADSTCANHVLSFYRELSLLERSWATLSPVERQQQRLTVLAPKFEALKTWAEAQRRELLATTPRSVMLGPFNYLLNHWEGLTRFLKDGRIPWHNNDSERLLRHIAVGRHAWMFRGTLKGARRACVLWSILRSCAMLGIDARSYMRDTLAALKVTPRSRLSTLTPKAYAARQHAALKSA